MTVAKLLVDMGPCDDNAYFYINGRLVVSTQLGEVRRFQRDLPDGDYNFRLQVLNSGGWAWQAKIRLVINGAERVAVDQVGGSGLFTGEVYNQEWQCRIGDGKVTEFN